MNAAFSWPGKARLAMSFVINIEEGSEMSVARGDKGPEPVDELGVALKKALYNYMHGIGPEQDVRRWFDMPVPKPRVARHVIERALAAR